MVLELSFVGPSWRANIAPIIGATSKAKKKKGLFFSIFLFIFTCIKMVRIISMCMLLNRLFTIQTFAVAFKIIP